MMRFILLFVFFAHSMAYSYDYSDLKLSAGETKCSDQSDLEHFVIDYNREKVVHYLRGQIFSESAQEFSKLQTKAKRMAITSTSLMIVGGVGIAAIGSSIKAGGLAIFKGASFIFPTQTFLKVTPLVVASDLAKVYFVIRYNASGAISAIKFFNRLNEEQIKNFQALKEEVYAIDRTTLIQNLNEFERRIKNYKKILYQEIDELEKQKLEETLGMRLKTLGWSVYANMKIEQMMARRLAEIHLEISDLYKIMQKQLEDLCESDNV